MANNITYLSHNKKFNMDNTWFDISTLDHFWIQWRYHFFKKHCPPEIYKHNNFLEIGCGSGLFMSQMESLLSKNVDGCDTNEAALIKSHPVSGQLYYYDIFDEHPSMTSKYDTIFLMDVLEHIEEDVAFLKASVKHLQPRGLICVNVPALPFLFSSYDTVQGHQRRYTIKSLTKVLMDCGIKIEKVQPWGISMIPVLALRKLLLSFFQEKDSLRYGFTSTDNIEQILSTLYKLEYSTISRCPIGTSILAFGTV